MRGRTVSRRHTDPLRGSITVGERENEPTGLITKIYGRERLVFSRQQICDDLLDSLPKLHAALRNNPYKNQQLWRRTSSEHAKVKTFELVGMPPNDGAVDGTDVNYALAASTKLKCHLNEVLNVLVSQTSSGYEATMQALSGKRFEAGELLYSERCRLVSNGGNNSQALLGVQMASVRPSWKLLLTPSHLCHPEHPSTQRLCFESLTHRYSETNRAVHVLKTLPKRIHDQIIPRDYRSALRGNVDHLGIAFDIDSKTKETEDGREKRVTRIFVHGYVASPRMESTVTVDNNGRPRSRTSPELWDQRGPTIVNSESKHILALFTSQLKEFERVIGRRRFGFQSFIYFQPLREGSTLCTTCQICLRRFSLFRKEFYCQICGNLACGECSQLYEVEARVGQVRKNRVCLHCVVRVDSCTFADEDIIAALGPTVVPLRHSSDWFRTFSGSEATESTDNVVELGRIILKTAPTQKESAKTQLERYVNQTLRDSQHKFPSSSLKTAELVRDYRYTFDASITMYEGHPLPPTPPAARETRRQHYIQASGILEPEYDHSTLDLLAQVAAQRLNCPIGFVSLIDDSLFHSVGTFPPRNFGLQAPRTESMCSHTVYVDKPLVIKNAQCDLRFAQLPVVRDHGIQFYFGFPIRAPDGSIVASLCTSDRVPHQNISTADYAIMQTLADVASQLIAPRDRVVSIPYQPRVRSISNCRMKQRSRSRRVKKEPDVTSITFIRQDTRLDNIHCL